MEQRNGHRLYVRDNDDDDDDNVLCCGGVLHVTEALRDCWCLVVQPGRKMSPTAADRSTHFADATLHQSSATSQQHP